MSNAIIDDSGYCSVHQSYHCECDRPSQAVKAAVEYAHTLDKAFSGSKPVEVNKQLGKCLDEAKEIICGERQDQYGAPEDSFQLVAEYWSTYLQKEYNSDHHHLKAKDIAHMMVLFKIARCQGQAPSRDSYVDICGYAAIAADRL